MSVFFLFTTTSIELNSSLATSNARLDQKSMYGFLFSKFYYLLDFLASVCQRCGVEKKLPSHDRLTASEGVEPSNATRIKNSKRQLRCYHLPFKATSLTLIMFLIERK
ncbi:hypothetical protein CHPC933_0037 [Streptococcus phage CHPC933]|nr:hypothetical protein CHPC933_0037 [Streptococcus phage CHPC933]